MSLIDDYEDVVVKRTEFNPDGGTADVDLVDEDGELFKTVTAQVEANNVEVIVLDGGLDAGAEEDVIAAVAAAYEQSREGL